MFTVQSWEERECNILRSLSLRCQVCFIYCNLLLWIRASCSYGFYKYLSLIYWTNISTTILNCQIWIRIKPRQQKLISGMYYLFLYRSCFIFQFIFLPGWGWGLYPSGLLPNPDQTNLMYKNIIQMIMLIDCYFSFFSQAIILVTNQSLYFQMLSKFIIHIFSFFLNFSVPIWVYPKAMPRPLSFENN